ncbi:MAG: hypothetical protein V4438_03305 [Patescibacteria group bacterium]
MSDRIRWSGYEFEYREKTADWFWAVGIIAVSFAAVAIIYDNALFGVFILIAGAMMLSTARKEPRLLDYEVTDKGIIINNVLHDHLEFKAFFVSQSKYAPPKLLLRTNKWTVPVLIIPIETDYIDAEKVRDFLLDYIPEEKIDESLSMKFMELLGF